MDQIHQFLNDPLVAGLYTILIIGLLDTLLGIYRSIQQGVFDWSKLPSVVDSTILQKFIPLAALGIASFFVTDPNGKTALVTGYLSFSGIVLAGMLNDFIQKATGSFVATNTDQDRGLGTGSIPSTEAPPTPSLATPSTKKP